MKTSYKYCSFLISLFTLVGCGTDDEILKLTITDISPGTTILGGNTLNTAMIGDTMAISGGNFSDIASDNFVFVHGIPSPVIMATNSEIKSIVPDDIPYSSVDVVVKRAGYQEATSSIRVRATPSPEIDGISPTSGTVGTIVTIYGKNLLETVEANTIIFTDSSGKTDVVISPFQPVLATSDSLQVQIPTGAGTGTINLYVKPDQNIDNNFFSIKTPIFTVIQ